jgi:hypothetical protein
MDGAKSEGSDSSRVEWFSANEDLRTSLNPIGKERGIYWVFKAFEKVLW